jgi:hypothetical protein
MKTIGEFYRERVLSLPKKVLSKRELPNDSGEIRVERDLFGWKVYAGKNFIECRSEEEARYLKIFVDLGVQEILVPKDDTDLKSLLPELERIKTKVDEILNSYLETILDRKIRERLKYEVYMEVVK